MRSGLVHFCSFQRSSVGFLVHFVRCFSLKHPLVCFSVYVCRVGFWAGSSVHPSALQVSCSSVRPCSSEPLRPAVFCDRQASVTSPALLALFLLHSLDQYAHLQLRYHFECEEYMCGIIALERFRKREGDAFGRISSSGQFGEAVNCFGFQTVPLCCLQGGSISVGCGNSAWHVCVGKPAARWPHVFVWLHEYL